MSAKSIVSVRGSIQAADFPEESSIVVHFNTIVRGDWTLLSGSREYTSPLCERGQNSEYHLDLQFENAFETSSLFLSPRYVITCYGRNRKNENILKGYGCLFLPMTPGKHTVKVSCWIPLSSSWIQRLTTKLRGLQPELVNAEMPAFADGRQSLRVTTKGIIEVEVNVSMKDFKAAPVQKRMN